MYSALIVALTAINLQP